MVSRVTLVLLSSLINSHYEMHFQGKHPHNVMRHNSALSLLRYTRCKARRQSACDPRILSKQDYFWRKEKNSLAHLACSSDMKYVHIGLTPWIFAQKWYRQNMSLEKTYFALWIVKTWERKNFWNRTLSFWGLSWTAPLKPARWAGWLLLARWHLKRTMYNMKNSFSLVCIHAVKYIFF